MEGTVTISIKDYEAIKLEQERNEYFKLKTWEMIKFLSNQLDLEMVDQFYTKHDICIEKRKSTTLVEIIGSGSKRYKI